MRYAKQMTVEGFGEDTQRRLSAATVALVGCGALGSWQAELLTRMGVGTLRIADGDTVSLDNLHRQCLFCERDAEEGLPKVTAAAARLAALNRSVNVVPFAGRVTRDTIGAFVADACLVLDATDHAMTRFLINDFCVERGLPWVYAGVAGRAGLVFPVLPPRGPCLRCLYPDPPGEDEQATCALNGILPMTVSAAVSLQVTQAVRILNGTAVAGTLIRLDAWTPEVRTVTVRRAPECPCCAGRRFEFLYGQNREPDPLATVVCGQRMVRVESRFWRGDVNVARLLAAAAQGGASAEQKGLLWVVSQAGLRVSLFPDGHLLVHDCAVPDKALAVVRQLFGEGQ